MNRPTEQPTPRRSPQTGSSPGPPLSPGQMLGNRYEIRRHLGRGGMGEVWQAFDLKLRIEVALKSIRKDWFADEALELLRHEVRAAREVASPNVCRIFDLVVERGQELVSMEYVDGVTLLKLLTTRGALALREVGEIATQFLSGLEAIHRAGFVHRDIKPENIMITRAGRVVIMDFGIAKAVTDGRTGTISGTPSYMAPEQLRGDLVDSRADVFAAGIVLAEIVSGEGIHDGARRQTLLTELRQEPPRLPDVPWRLVLERAVSKEPDKRYPTARALALALEQVTLREEVAEDRNPYPGLRSFTEADAQFFFGRETEVETAWKKLRRLHLMALIGPSGAGKSSLIRAGVIPARPEGWGFVVAAPGSRPFTALAQALATELAGDPDVVSELIQMEDQDLAVAAVSRWRNQHQEALLVLDQFEELFTLNHLEVQKRFSRLVGRLVIEADVRVLVSLRDDFLLHCHDHEPLEPIFSELMPLSLPVGDALRRAVVQPALLCGYRFEDEALVEEMLSEVAEERGALPLLAFTVARLWQMRDLEAGVLSREAYREIGGVGGALAQHAEATLTRIGIERAPIVREVFRNLVTAQGTRAAREREDLLSVFGAGQEEAREVVRELVDARLLTEFEVSVVEGSDEEPRARVEIIHESLLSAWPRLVRWRTQDAAGAELRDQLRQAAQLWQERGRPEDLLWSGASFREFELWREHYPGGLTANEAAFAGAMVEHAERRRRRRRLLSVGAVTLLVTIAAVFAMLWRQSETSRQEAIREVKRREAAQLLALGRIRLDDYPTAAVAYALASLETADSPEARRFAVEALSRGPTAFVLPENIGWVEFSPDGRWLATTGAVTPTRLFSRDGGATKDFGGAGGRRKSVRVAPESDLLVRTSGKNVHFWSLSEGKEIRNLELEGPTASLLRRSRLITFTTGSDEEEVVRSWPLEGGEPRLIARWDARGVTLMEDGRRRSVDANGEQITYARLDSVYLSRLRDLDAAGERLVGKHRAKVLATRFHPAGDGIYAGDKEGEIRLWPLSGGSAAPKRILRVRPPEAGMVLDLDPNGRRLIAAHVGAHSTSEVAYLWDLAGPPDAEPLVLRNGDTQWLNTLAVHPEGDWLATANGMFAGIVWPLNRRYAYVLRGQSPPFIRARFTPDGKWLASSSDDGTVRLWPLSPASGERSRILMEDETARLGVRLSVDPTGKNVLAVDRMDSRTFLVPLEGGEPRSLPVPPGLRGGPGQETGHAFSPDGHLVAIGRTSPAHIQLVDLRSGRARTLDTRVGEEDCGFGENYVGAVWELEFTREGRLFAAGSTGLRLWNLEEGTNQLLLPCREKLFRRFAVSPDGRQVLVMDFDLSKTRPSVLGLLDLDAGTSREIVSHGNRMFDVALDPSGKIAVTGDYDGIVRVGPVSGEEPHLLYGHRPGMEIASVDVSPDGLFVASASQDGTIRLWPMPEGRPFHRLPYEELLERLRALTNLRLVPDDETETGYRLDAGPFPGWKTAPTW